MSRWIRDCRHVLHGMPQIVNHTHQSIDQPIGKFRLFCCSSLEAFRPQEFATMVCKPCCCWTFRHVRMHVWAFFSSFKWNFIDGAMRHENIGENAHPWYWAIEHWHRHNCRTNSCGFTTKGKIKSTINQVYSMRSYWDNRSPFISLG